MSVPKPVQAEACGVRGNRQECGDRTLRPRGKFNQGASFSSGSGPCLSAPGDFASLDSPRPSLLAPYLPRAKMPHASYTTIRMARDVLCDGHCNVRPACAVAVARHTARAHDHATLYQTSSTIGTIRRSAGQQKARSQTLTRLPSPPFSRTASRAAAPVMRKRPLHSFGRGPGSESYVLMPPGLVLCPANVSAQPRARQPP
jgi:hypothetical protein